MLLRHLEKITIEKATKTKQSNGSYVNTYTKVNDYNCIVQDLITDEISATVYGASINKMIRLLSPLKDMESFLLTKVNNTEDNVSNYFAEYNNNLYKIVSVSKDRVDVERL